MLMKSIFERRTLVNLHRYTENLHSAITMSHDRLRGSFRAYITRYYVRV